MINFLIFFPFKITLLLRSSFCLLMILLSLNSEGQEVKIQLINEDSNLPVEGAVLIVNNSQNHISDAQGFVIIIDPDPSDTIAVLMLGYYDYFSSYTSVVKNSFEISLKPSPLNLNAIVISANKAEEDIKDSPFQISLLSKSQIREVSPQTTADLLQQSGQVNVQKSQGGGGSPVLRGFEANKVLLVVDGIRLNNAIYRGGHLQNVITIDPFMLKKAEVLFGPASVVYGSDALGGVMNFVTMDPHIPSDDSILYTSGNLDIRFASANTSTVGHLDFTISKNGFGSLTSLSYARTDDLRMGKHRKSEHGDWGKRKFIQSNIDGNDTTLFNQEHHLQSPSGYNQLDILQKFNYRSSDNTKHKLNIQLSRSGDVPRYDRLTDTITDGSFKFGDWHYGPQIRMLAAYQIEHEMVSKFSDKINTSLAYQYIEESRNTRQYGSYDLTNRKEQLNIYSLNTDFHKSISLSEFMYGAEIVYNEVMSTAKSTNITDGTSSPASTRYPDGGSGYLSSAIYLTHKRRVKKFILEQGVRFNYIVLNATFNDTSFYKFPVQNVKQNNIAMSGLLGFIYLPTDKFRLYLMGASGFRAPNIDDLGKVFDSRPGVVIVPNPDLEPEYTLNLETGFTIDQPERFHLQASGWYTWYRNAIITTPSTINGSDSIIYDGVLSKVFTNSNTLKAFIYGISASAKFKFSNKFYALGAITKTIGKVDLEQSNQPLDHIPPLFGKLSVEYHSQKITSSVFILFNGEKPLDEYGLSGEDNLRYALATGTPSWTTLNFLFNFHVTSFTSIQLNVENILDEHYRVFSSGISSAGRNFIITLHTRF